MKTEPIPSIELLPSYGAGVFANEFGGIKVHQSTKQETFAEVDLTVDEARRLAAALIKMAKRIERYQQLNDALAEKEENATH